MRVKAIILASITIAAACDTPEEVEEHNIVVFDAMEVNRSLQEDPSQRFLVDISDETVNYFDESSEEIDFSQFFFFCPSMAAPLPLEDVAEELLQDRPQKWSVQLTAPADEVSFRAECVMICQNGQDCYERCPAQLPKQPSLPPPLPKLE